MGLFKNGIGRPSNETLRKRRTAYFLIALAVVMAIGYGVVSFKNSDSTSDDEIKSTGKNIKVVKNIKGDIAAEPDYTKKDGILTDDDADLILKFSVKLKTPTKDQQKYADVDGDGSIDPADARLVSRAVYGYYDYNKDGEVDSKDVNIISKKSGASKTDINIVKRLAAGYGDVATAPNYAKSDGKITKDDVQAISEIIEESAPISSTKAEKIDINNDGKFDGADLLEISKKVDFSKENEDEDDDRPAKVAEIQDALLETANAFLSRGKDIQYDSWRRTHYLKPEDATAYNTGYTVCSGFTSQTYYNALDVSQLSYYDKAGNKKKGIPLYVEDILNFALQEQNKNKTVFKYDEKYLYGANTGYNDFSDFYERIKNKLQVGDIIVWTEHNPNGADAGHAQMYVGNGLIMESHTPEEARKNKKYAARYNYDESRDVYEEYGTVTLYDLKSRIWSGSKSSKKRNNSMDRLWKYFVAIRPYAGENVKITDSAKLRIEFPGLKITKIAEILDSNNKVIKTQNGTLNSGEKIRYKIIIENTSDKDFKGTLKVEERFSVEDFSIQSNSKLSYAKGTGVLSGSTVNLKSNSSATFSYVLVLRNGAKVNNRVGTTGKVYSNKNTVGITLPKIETFVGKSLTESQKTDLLAPVKLETDFPGVVVTKTAEILDSSNNKINQQIGVITSGNRIRYTVTVENTSDKDYTSDLLVEEKYSTTNFSLKDYKKLTYVKGTGVLLGKAEKLKKGTKKTFIYVLDVRDTIKNNSVVSTTGKVYTDSNKNGLTTEKINMVYVSSLTNTVARDAKLEKEFPGIRVTKTAIIYNGKSSNINHTNGKISIGDKIQYRVVVENTSSKNYTGTIKIEEKYPTSEFSLKDYKKLTYAKGTGVLSGSVSNLKAGDKQEFIYTLVIRDVVKANSIISTNGKVYSDKNKTGIETQKIRMVANGVEPLDASGLKFIKNMYSNSKLSQNIKNSVNEIPDSLQTIIKVVKNDSATNVNGIRSYGISVNSNYSKIIAGNNYGVRIGPRDAKIANGVVSCYNAWNMNNVTPKTNRTRELRTDMLESGDIVYIKTKADDVDSEKAFIYVVSNNTGYLYRRYYSNNDIIESIFTPTFYEKRIINRNSVEITKNENTNINKYLRDIVGNNFVVLKPSNVN